MGQDHDAKRAAIYDLLKGYWQLAEKLDRSLLDSYANACAECSVEAVRLVCQRIASGQAGLNSSYPPTPADIAERAALLTAGGKPAPPLLTGIVEMDFGHGRVDMRGLERAEQDAIINANGKIGKRNAALMSLEEKREALKQLAIGAPVRAVVEARLQKL